MNKTKEQRIVVVGGGLVGAATVLGLAAHGREVTLIDRKRPEVSAGKLGADIRNVALNPRSQSLLENLDVWTLERVVPYKHMVVWEERGTARVTFNAQELGRSELGWLIEVSPLLTRMWAAFGDRVTLIEGGVEALDVDDAVTLQLDGDRTTVCDLLIAADGGQSAIRRGLGVGVDERPVDQMALATVVRTSLSHRDTAWQRFLRDGPLALLPSIEPDLVSIVWTGSVAETKRRVELTDTEFCRLLTQASESRLGDVIAVDTRVSFPLTQQHVTDPVMGSQVVFIGDAARVIHPLAGLGVNLGFEDVSALLAIAEKTDNLCRPDVWRRFSRERAFRAKTMIRILEGLNRLYGAQDPGIGLIRNLGVRWVDNVSGVKHQIMREAMGLGHF
ncbi:MAG: FAD-dependent oxidoreductase [Pseudomonadales bacterium]|nr:FAD-dependent oxidoreductase [Pseudomonadales bacterium]